MKKYEFTGVEKAQGGVILHQIRAVRDFGSARAGDVGGWVVSGRNLSHDGNAWVYGDAMVYSDAMVYGDARVCGDALVYGDAWVCGDARVYGDARVCGGVWDRSPCFIQGTRWSMNVSSPDTVRCGCQDHTWKEWRDRYAEISERHNAGDVLGEYIQYFNLLCKRYGHEDCVIGQEEIAHAGTEGEARHAEEN